jgi:FkbM family methyltransferase
MTVLERLSKPQYIYRPSQILRRMRLGDEAEIVVPTPWGSPLLVAQKDTIGAGIARMGVHELAVSEAMWRLADREDLALDVGANIGYFAGLLARRVSEVIAFEPNPQLYRFIASNIERWDAAGLVVLDTRAASDKAGTAVLHLPADFESNYGIATLEPGAETVSHEVPTVRLDDVIEGRRVGILKLDVEGHELSVLRGAGSSLRDGLIRDVFFEDHQPLPSPVSSLLEAEGFTINGIEERLAGPVLTAAGHVPEGLDAPTYLATRDPERAARLMGPRGWLCLRSARREG